jgi:hypothetical protein
MNRRSSFAVGMLDLTSNVKRSIESEFTPVPLFFAAILIVLQMSLFFLRSVRRPS